ncbi:MAG: HDOD domain-containing protein [Sandaracinus sp.]
MRDERHPASTPARASTGYEAAPPRSLPAAHVSAAPRASIAGASGAPRAPSLPGALARPSSDPQKAPPSLPVAQRPSLASRSSLPNLRARQTPLTGTRSTPLPHESLRASLVELDLETALRTQVLSRNADLPVLPATAMEALRLVRDPRMRTDELLSVVEQDPPLAARILAVANSTYYARGNAIRSLRQAVVRLGLHTLRDVIYMAIYASTLFDAPGLVDVVRETFEHSVIVARFAQRMAPHLGFDDETAFLAGLLHDVGKARCCKVLAKLPQAKGKSREELMPLIDSLHEKAGAALARAWNLPDEVAQACESHHQPKNAFGTLICAADAVAHALDDPPETVDLDVLDEKTQRVGMSAQEALELFGPMRAEMAARASAMP